MVDSVDVATRSRIMAKVRCRDTLPELALRKALFRQGFRYRLHCPMLPGKPDIVFPDTEQPYLSMDVFGIGTAVARTCQRRMLNFGGPR